MHSDEVPLIISKAVGWLAGIFGVALTMVFLYVVWDALKGSTNYFGLSVFFVIGIFIISFPTRITRKEQPQRLKDTKNSLQI